MFRDAVKLVPEKVTEVSYTGLASYLPGRVRTLNPDAPRDRIEWHHSAIMYES